MNSEFNTGWSGEPQWKVTYLPGRVAGNVVVRDLNLAPASWYLTPWEADAALARGLNFAQLVTPNDPRLPVHMTAHQGPALVTLTCTRCGQTGTQAADLRGDHTTCAPPTVAHTLDVPLPAIEEPAPVPRQVIAAPRPAGSDPTCRDAWFAAAQTGSLVEGIDMGWPSRDRDVLTPWTVEVSFDINAYDADHAKQIANLLALITGGQISGLSEAPSE